MNLVLTMQGKKTQVISDLRDHLRRHAYLDLGADVLCNGVGVFVERVTRSLVHRNRADGISRPYGFIPPVNVIVRAPRGMGIEKTSAGMHAVLLELHRAVKDAGCELEKVALIGYDAAMDAGTVPKMPAWVYELAVLCAGRVEAGEWRGEWV